jgi:hypothetical protein
VRIKLRKEQVREVLDLQYRFRKLRPLLDNFDFCSDDHKLRTLDFVKYESRAILDRLKTGKVDREEILDRLGHCHELLDMIETELKLGPPNVSAMFRLKIFECEISLEQIF